MHFIPRYLTGCLEPDCVLVMEVDQGRESSHLFLRDRDKKSELWDGARSRPDAATAEFFGVDACHTVSELGAFLNHYRRDSVEFCLWYQYLEPKCQNIHKLVMDFVHNLVSSQGIAAPR